MKTVGQLLKEERKKQGKTLAEMSQKTKIPENSLGYLENDDCQNLPATTFIKGFIRNYAQELNLQPEKILAVYRRDNCQGKEKKIVPEGVAKPLDSSFSWSPKLTAILISVLVITAVFGFLFLQLRGYLFAPILQLDKPREMEVVSDFQTQVSGKTNSDASLYINNELVSVDFDGNFSQNLKLLPGENIVKVKAVSRTGKESEIIRKVLVDKQP